IDSVAKPEAETQIDSVAKPEAEAKIESETMPEAEAKIDSVAKPEAEAKIESVAKPEAVAKPESEIEPEEKTPVSLVKEILKIAPEAKNLARYKRKDKRGKKENARLYRKILQAVPDAVILGSVKPVPKQWLRYDDGLFKAILQAISKAMSDGSLEEKAGIGEGPEAKAGVLPERLTGTEAKPNLPSERGQNASGRDLGLEGGLEGDLKVGGPQNASEGVFEAEGQIVSGQAPKEKTIGELVEMILNKVPQVRTFIGLKRKNKNWKRENGKLYAKMLVAAPGAALWGSVKPHGKHWLKYNDRAFRAIIEVVSKALADGTVKEKAEVLPSHQAVLTFESFEKEPEAKAEVLLERITGPGPEAKLNLPAERPKDESEDDLEG
ncbi:MAG: hypothetical protein LBF38_12275, partial [Deltaproteobacteria bacterium]|nr:hypothetical protein [Deltaproteobacteria bacterium]